MDNNFSSHVELTGFALTGASIAPLNPIQYSDVFKFSNCVNTFIYDCHIEGGSEDAIDMCRGSNYVFRNSTISPNGKNGITIKGDINGVILDNVSFLEHGKETDIELGQYSVYATFPFSGKTKQIHLLNVTSADGAPVKVKLWNATDPIVEGGNVQVTRVKPILVWLYFLLRAIQVKITGKK